MTMELQNNQRATAKYAPSASLRRDNDSGVFDHDSPAPPPAPRLRSAVNEEPSAVPMTMPAPAPQAAEDIARVSVEGRPADAKSGPGMLMLEMGFILVLVAAVSVATGIWVGWGLGVAMFVVGSLALMCNPVIGATAMRARDRQEVAKQEQIIQLDGRRPVGD
jgi:hypothetical protein